MYIPALHYCFIWVPLINARSLKAWDLQNQLVSNDLMNGNVAQMGSQ